MLSAPKVLIQSKLRLSGELEQRLMDHCVKRRTSIRTEMGFLDGVATAGLGVQGGATMWRGSTYTGFARIRAEAHAMYENDFSFRALPGNAKRFSTLFQHFNESVNVPKRAINVYKARACEALVNTSPFTGFMPEGQDDDADARTNAEIAPTKQPGHGSSS